MQTQDAFIIHSATAEEAAALRAFVKALKIKFEGAPNGKQYNPECVAKIKKGEKEVENWEYTRVENKIYKKF